MSFVPGGDVDLVALDLPLELHGRLALDDAETELRGHLLGIVGVDRQLAGNLLVGQIEAHQVQAQHPDREWLMMAGEHGARQIIEATAAYLAQIPSPLWLRFIVPLSGDVRRVAVGAMHAVGPAHRADGLVALCIVDQQADLEHPPTLILSTAVSNFLSTLVADGSPPERRMSLARNLYLAKPCTKDELLARLWESNQWPDNVPRRRIDTMVASSGRDAAAGGTERSPLPATSSEGDATRVTVEVTLGGDTGPSASPPGAPPWPREAEKEARGGDTAEAAAATSTSATENPQNEEGGTGP